mmetsp:Transcript_8339/g.16047  ORF Transcript_8339/g.16047 Transcript_8339/m.16047 type:complete len:161 (-) Transcript_8339:16-498(-)
MVPNEVAETTEVMVGKGVHNKELEGETNNPGASNIVKDGGKATSQGEITSTSEANGKSNTSGAVGNGTNGTDRELVVGRLAIDLNDIRGKRPLLDEIEVVLGSTKELSSLSIGGRFAPELRDLVATNEPKLLGSKGSSPQELLGDSRSGTGLNNSLKHFL